MNRRLRIEALVEESSASIKIMLAGKGSAITEGEKLRKLIDVLSTQNELDYYSEFGDLSGENTKQKFIETSEMYKIVSEIFLMEIEKFTKGVVISK
jgi:hypothetical protein